jgi:hypothetical protein
MVDISLHIGTSVSNFTCQIQNISLANDLCFSETQHYASHLGHVLHAGNANASPTPPVCAICHNTIQWNTGTIFFNLTAECSIREDENQGEMVTSWTQSNTQLCSWWWFVKCTMIKDCSGYKLGSTYIKTIYMNIIKESQLLILIINVHGKTF